MRDDTPHSTTPGVPDDAWLEALLREDRGTSTPECAAAEAFTARVLAALPPDPAGIRRATRRRRLRLVLIGSLLGAFIAWILGGAALAQSAREITALASAAAAQNGTGFSPTTTICVGLSAFAMLLLAGRGTWRRLFN